MGNNGEVINETMDLYITIKMGHIKKEFHGCYIHVLPGSRSLKGAPAKTENMCGLRSAGEASATLAEPCIMDQPDTIKTYAISMFKKKMKNLYNSSN
ncbi:hypothetical protein J6590_005033 [Homalodisca vitripennis]|nr:hypothetical protein J6590_005033 [Homalodisca vitripennis]